MKKFSGRQGFCLLISFCASLCVIIGLCGWIYLDFRGDENRERFFLTEADTAAQRLMESIDKGDAILAYHYAEKVRENAARAGERETAQTLAALSETIRITGITEEVRCAAENCLNGSGIRTEEESAAIPDEAFEPAEVALIRRNDALAAAEEIMGVNNLLTQSVRCRNGEFLFTCRNAYAVIDEKTALPVEIGISLPEPRTAALTPEECEAHAGAFLRKYFPAADLRVSRVYPEGDGTVTVEYRMNGRIVKAAVRQDSGKIVRYIAR